MEALSITVTADREAPPRARAERSAQREVTKSVEIPSAAPIAQQVLARIILLALAGGSFYLLGEGDSVGLQVAGASVFVLSASVLIVWAAAAFGTGLGPKRLLEIFGTVIGVMRASCKEDEEPQPSDASPGRQEVERAA